MSIEDIQPTPDLIKKMEEFLRPKKYKFDCDECGKEFPTNSRTKRFCSNKCQKKFYLKGATKVDRPKRSCPKCRRKYTPTAHNQLYCSIKCKRLAATKDLVCEVCGAKFLGRRAKYCSEKCRLSVVPEKERIEFTCTSCGRKLLSRNPARKFCSAACHKKHRREQSSTSLLIDGTVIKLGLTNHEARLCEEVLSKAFERIGIRAAVQVISSTNPLTGG